jgi:endoglycosylceramidase
LAATDEAGVLGDAAGDAPGPGPADSRRQETSDLRAESGLGTGEGRAGCPERPAPAGPQPYRTDGTHILDAQGRTLVLRGVNYPSDDVAHWADEPPDADLADLQFIAQSGFNAIRLVINWDRIEPEPEALDQDYIELVARHATGASELGLYVVIDLHQDLFGLGFGLHGAPLWACSQELYDSFEPGEPWFFNYFSPSVSGCFDGFWKSPELQKHQQDAARAVAEAVAEGERVLGFDPHNEPFPGTFGFQEFEADYLWPYYQAFADNIEAALPGRLLFFEPSVLFSVNQATTFPPASCPQQAVFFPHYYNGGVEMDHLWDENVQTDSTAVAAAAAEAARMQVPWGYGELGGALDTPNLDAYLLSLYTLLDQAQASAFLWIFSHGTGGFGLVDSVTGDWHPHAAAFLRPAPSAVAGIPLSFDWDYEAGVFSMSWDEEAGAGDSEIIVPAWVDGVGYSLVVDGEEVQPAPSPYPGRIVIPGGVGGTRDLVLTAHGHYDEAGSR